MTANSAVVLDDLAQEINQHDKSKRACEVKGIMHTIRMGEILIEAKKVAPHGTFRDWVNENTTVSQRMAQMYMTVARNSQIVDMVASEYETISHLTLTQAVKLARQHKTLDAIAENIKGIDKRRQDSQRDMAAGLASARESFEGDGETFKKWMVEDVGFSQSFAETAAGLIGEEYDDGAWMDALLTDLEAGKFPAKLMEGMPAE